MITREATAPLIADNPIELIEEIVCANEWPFDRVADEELSVEILGSWCKYRLRFSWCRDYEALQVLCGFDMRVPTEKTSVIYHLLGLINENVWLGHFDLWSREGVPMFRYGALMRGGRERNREQCEDLIDISVRACDQFYPAFQLVVWGNHDPAQALAASIIEPQGSA